MTGSRPRGPRVIVFDDDHYYLGSVLAELLAAEGHEVRLVTPAAHVSAWTANTLELVRVRQRVMSAGVVVDTNRAVVRLTSAGVVAACVFTGAEESLDADAVVMVTARLPSDGLAADLQAREAEWAGASVTSVRAIGDAWAPATIAAAVWSGRRYAEELDEPVPAGPVSFRREVTALAPEQP